MSYFGTDGIRQEAEKFTSEFLGSIVVGLSDYVATLDFGRPAKVLIAGDTRESTEWILQDLAVALESLGFEYASAEILPTPAINYCFYEMGFDFAIDVTASHNPYVDNGIKIFERGATSGIKLSGAGREYIEKAILEGKTFSAVSLTDRENLHDEAVSLYKEHLLKYLGETDLSGLKIGIDFANGAMSVISGSVFSELHATVSEINVAGGFTTKINDGCGSTHLESLCKLVTDERLDFGVAYDGDGDRCLLVNGDGEVVDGDEIIAIIAEYLGLDKIAVTVMANQGILNFAAEKNINAEVTAVGDSNVAEAMRLNGIRLGGEQSGHIILPGETTGDGMLTSLYVSKIVAESKKNLKELAGVMEKLPQVMVNVTASKEQKAALVSSEEAKKLLLLFDEKAKDLSGRILVRPSGTENLIRVTMWGNDMAKITELVNELADNLSKILYVAIGYFEGF